ncbi:MAG: diguanylate phosphodiesterase [Anaerolineales bacterium]|nr:diguanylate phosphodiesterase [Anaerolineales bacterium]
MLIHLIYCSAARYLLNQQELADLLCVGRRNNAKVDITGMLLYSQGSFFQVLEGDEQSVERLFSTIQQDPRHHSITVIVREPIASRSFSNWCMGFAEITSSEAGVLMGDDVLADHYAFVGLGVSRARKLLAAFRTGHWRQRIAEYDQDIKDLLDKPGDRVMPIIYPPASAPAPSDEQPYSFAFQPILSARSKCVFAYEALLRGRNNEPARQVLQSVLNASTGPGDSQLPLAALQLAAFLGLSTNISLNIIPSSAVTSPTTIPQILAAAQRFQIRPEQIILEIVESEMIADFDNFTAAIRKFRSSGLLFAIDDFGAGYAGLNLLAEFQPHLIKLDRHLVQDVDRNGPRQAILRGILRTCFELGIEVIAEGVETQAEYRWLQAEGIDLFQGYLLARPAFEQLTDRFYLPD